MRVYSIYYKEKLTKKKQKIVITVLWSTLYILLGFLLFKKLNYNDL